MVNDCRLSLQVPTPFLYNPYTLILYTLILCIKKLHARARVRVHFCTGICMHVGEDTGSPDSHEL